MSVNSLEWARNLQRELKSEIRMIARRRGADDGDVEALGLLPQTDHLADVRQRLTQVERLIDAIEDPGAGDGPGWFPAMSAEGAPAGRAADRTR